MIVNPKECDTVETIRSHTGGLGVDVAYEVAGIEQTINAAIQSTRSEGNIVNISIWEKPASIPLNGLILTERKIDQHYRVPQHFPAGHPIDRERAN